MIDCSRRLIQWICMHSWITSKRRKSESSKQSRRFRWKKLTTWQFSIANSVRFLIAWWIIILSLTILNCFFRWMIKRAQKSSKSSIWYSRIWHFTRFKIRKIKRRQMKIAILFFASFRSTWLHTTSLNALCIHCWNYLFKRRFMISAKTVWLSCSEIFDTFDCWSLMKSSW